MANPTPLIKRNIVKKKVNKIKRWHSDRYMRVGESWRRPFGIDGRFRRTGPHVKIGYGSNKKTKFLLPNGLYKFGVSNVRDLELLLMHNRTYCAEIASNVSTRKRKEILERAEQLNIRVINGEAKFEAEEQ